MCGINGFIELNNQKSSYTPEVLEGKLRVMNNLIAHRGPDAEGILLQAPIGFGFRRLSIIDLSDSANQPMWSQDGQVVLIFNGEIYNYIEVRKELLAKGYTFQTESDSEVILQSYIEYGDQCVEKFNGMWALALYDFRKQRLFCSRDRMGVKPFYYCIKDNELFFSSELKALHAACDLRKANLQKVFRYLAYGYRMNDGETFFEGCAELLPATNMVYENGQLRFYKYWNLQENLFQHDPSLSVEEEYVRLFEDAVKLRYRSDVPVALLLSGGLDSTSIARVTEDLIDRGSLGQTEVHAFVASFPDYEYDETEIVRKFAKSCKHIQLHEIVVDGKSISGKLEDILYGLDHPLGSFASIAHNNIMKVCHEKGIKVVLNGQGSDEAFAGYDRYIAGVHLLDQLLSRKGHFFKEFKILNQVNGYSKLYLIKQMIKPVLSKQSASFYRAKYQEKSIPCLDRDFIQANKNHFNSGYQFSWKGNNLTNYLLDAINYQDLNTILHYEDVSSMQQSVEIRSPFLDYRIMEFAFSIPNEMKFKEGITKKIHRETIGKRLPDFITKNRQKIGFKTPFEKYLSADPLFKAYIFDILLSDQFRSKKIWNADKVIDKFQNPERHPGFPFWRIINLEIWSKVFQINNL